MSGYKYKYEAFTNSGTGPLQSNPMCAQLVHKLKHCDYCDNDKDPGGGIQRTASKWACAGCWRLLKQGSSVKKGKVSFSPT